MAAVVLPSLWHGWYKKKKAQAGVVAALWTLLFEQARHGYPLSCHACLPAAASSHMCICGDSELNMVIIIAMYPSVVVSHVSQTQDLAEIN